MRNAFGSIAMLAGLLLSSTLSAQEPENPPAIRIKLHHPDRQLEEILKLFEGSKAKSPAAALAAWKRASKNPNQLGKPLEALIASFNPRMVGELKTLDQAEVSIHFDQETGQPVWSAILPKDDGTFAALGSAFVLSGGAAEPPLGEFAVDRLAGPGSALLAKVEAGTTVASDRERLKLAKSRIEAAPELDLEDKTQGELELFLERGSLKGSKSLAIRRAEELFRSVNLAQPRLRPLMGTFGIGLDIKDGTFNASALYIDMRSYPNVSVKPQWFDWTPREGVFASFALATDPTVRTWNDFFALIDRLEKVDPAKSDVASIQIRLDLLARLGGLRLETDLLQHLQGVSGWLGSSDSNQFNRALVVLHLDDSEAADRIVAGVKPLPGSGLRPVAEPERPRWLGRLEGESLRISRLDRALVLTWGDGVLDASIKARDNLDFSAGPLIRQLWDEDTKPLLAGYVWPERIPGLGLDGKREKKDAELPAIRLQLFKDFVFVLGMEIEWVGVNETIKTFLDKLPLDPPSDH